MSYDYFDHEADIGIIGCGDSIEHALTAAAQAVFAIMVDPTLVCPKQVIAIEFEEDDIELALVRWLNLLIANARINAMIFNKFELKRSRAKWQGKAWGEPWREGLERGTEVKGATLTALKVVQQHGHWRAQCVVDV